MNETLSLKFGWLVESILGSQCSASQQLVCYLEIGFSLLTVLGRGLRYFECHIDEAKTYKFIEHDITRDRLLKVLSDKQTQYNHWRYQWLHMQNTCSLLYESKSSDLLMAIKQDALNINMLKSDRYSCCFLIYCETYLIGYLWWWWVTIISIN